MTITDKERIGEPRADARLKKETMERPQDYQRLPVNSMCGCTRLWRDPDGSYWCCRAQEDNPPAARCEMTEDEELIFYLRANSKSLASQALAENSRLLARGSEILWQAAQRLEQLTGWASIATAPKDGTSVLVYVPSKPLPQRNCPSSRWKMFTPRVLEARFIKPPLDDEHLTIGRHERELEEKFGGYWTADPRCIGALRGMPTHWMPLPHPPQGHEVAGSSNLITEK